MRAVNNSNATTGGVNGHFGHWHSPIPFLFGGLGLMLLLIATALLILACSYRNSSSNLRSENEDKPGKRIGNMMKGETEPKIVVIMAGDQNPTYLAMPNPVSACSCQTSQHV
ncbi:hypothetical protein EZV62_015705 [Acer yangbiense]|uniref:Uncharacterized protein n=1 Tax=Acer yangbiense TaxID=1000413 RepID=A0A5C7HNJ8_9ROSI|nr:hypothetical protein EZV62_015705 [Acer yangbiense]